MTGGVRRGHSRCNTGLNDLLRYTVKTGRVRGVVALVDGKVKVVGSIDLDVEEAGAARGRLRAGRGGSSRKEMGRT